MNILLFWKIYPEKDRENGHDDCDSPDVNEKNPLDSFGMIFNVVVDEKREQKQFQHFCGGIFFHSLDFWTKAKMVTRTPAALECFFTTKEHKLLAQEIKHFGWLFILSLCITFSVYPDEVFAAYRKQSTSRHVCAKYNRRSSELPMPNKIKPKK